MNKKLFIISIGVFIIICTGILLFFYKPHDSYYRYDINGENITYNRTILTNCKSDTFKVIYDTPSATSAYAMCNNQIYIGEDTIEGVDIGSFSVLFFNGGQQADDYSKDKNYVYKYNHIITGADSDSFQYLGGEFAKDTKHIFYDGEIISGADAKTFQIFPLVDGFAKDTKNIYRCTNILSGENSKSFETIENFGYGNYRYYPKDCKQLITGDKTLSIEKFKEIAFPTN